MGVRWLLLITVGILIVGALSSTNHDEEENDPEISNGRNVRSAVSEAVKEQKQKIRRQQIKRKNNLRQRTENNDKAKRKYQGQKKTNRPKKNTLKQKSKRQKGLKNKGKIRRKKIKQTRKRKTKQKKFPTRQTQTCSVDSPVSKTCMENAKDVLVFEANLVTNYLKQSKQLLRHAGQADNKMGKKGQFEHAAEHMLMAIGGNLSKPLCGKNSSDSETRNKQNRKLDLHLENYDKLMNCSNAIKENCTVPPEAYNDTMLVKVKECNSSLEEYRKFTKTCLTDAMKKNATGQCNCWAEAKAKMDAIKVLKCSINKEKKKVTEEKKNCVSTFIKCKKMEDESINLIYTCMSDHSMHIINQTAASLHSGAMKDTGKALAGADETAKAVVSGEVDLGKQLDTDPYNDHK